MILYLDTSALVKIYILEEGSSIVRKLAKKAEALASHEIAYVEMYSAFSRLKREEIVSEKEFQTLKKRFEEDWESYLRVNSGNSLFKNAADFCENFGLRAYDSLHLASAHYLNTHSLDLIFACFDTKLAKAANKLKMKLL